MCWWLPNAYLQQRTLKLQTCIHIYVLDISSWASNRSFQIHYVRNRTVDHQLLKTCSTHSLHLLGWWQFKNSSKVKHYGILISSFYLTPHFQIGTMLRKYPESNLFTSTAWSIRPPSSEPSSSLVWVTPTVSELVFLSLRLLLHSIIFSTVQPEWAFFFKVGPKEILYSKSWIKAKVFIVTYGILNELTPFYASDFITLSTYLRHISPQGLSVPFFLCSVGLFWAFPKANYYPNV